VESTEPFLHLHSHDGGGYGSASKPNQNREPFMSISVLGKWTYDRQVSMLPT